MGSEARTTTTDRLDRWSRRMPVVTRDGDQPVDDPRPDGPDGRRRAGPVSWTGQPEAPGGDSRPAPGRPAYARPVRTDAELVRMARDDGDREAFGLLYDRYVTRVYRYCFRRLGTREAAEDATSQVFLRALAALPAQRDREVDRDGSGPGSGSFAAWLFTIADRTVIDSWRRQRPTAPLDGLPEPFDPEPSPEDAALSAERGATLRDLIATLPPDQRRAIELRLADLSGPEVARVMGRPPGAVKMLQFRAISTLRRLLGASPAGLDDHRLGTTDPGRKEDR